MQIRSMTPADFDFALDLTAAENWQGVTREAFAAAHEHDPQGCFVAEDNNRRIGICVATNYGEYGFLGNLIVVPDYRNLGHGRAIMQHAIAYLESRGCRNILLDGDLPAVPLYERLGFRKVCLSLRYLGRVEPGSPPTVRAMIESDLADVCALDLRAFNADRSFFLRYRLRHFARWCKVIESAGKIAGYIAARPGQNTTAVGPWVVSGTTVDPLDLLHALALEGGDQQLRLGILETNRRAVGIMEALGSVKKQTPCWRMVRGPSADLGLSGKCIAVGSPDKG